MLRIHPTVFDRLSRCHCCLWMLHHSLWLELICPAAPCSSQRSHFSILKCFCPKTHWVCFRFHLPLCLAGTVSQIPPPCDLSKCNHLHTYGAKLGILSGPWQSSSVLVHYKKVELNSVLLIKITATPHHLRPPGQMNIHPGLDVAHEYLWWLTPDMQMSQPTQMASDHT